MLPQVKAVIEDSSQVGEARRSICRVCEIQDFSEEDCSRASLVATELATNLLKHAKKGELLLQGFDGEVQIMSIDHGPGIEDLGKSLADGYSTSGTPGNGLGAIRRLSDRFDIFSTEGKGTVVSATIGKQRKKTQSRTDLWGAIHLPYPGEFECGDGWSMATSAEMASFIVSDGLGHGPLAGQASKDAASVFEKDPYLAPTRILEEAHSHLKGGRGAAVACALVDINACTVCHSGVGNISGYLVDSEVSKGLLSHNGTVGLQAAKIDQTQYTWNNETILVLHSDGISNRWSLSAYPGLIVKSPSVICGVLYRDFYRVRDDVTILAVRLSALRNAA